MVYGYRYSDPLINLPVPKKLKKKTRMTISNTLKPKDVPSPSDRAVVARSLGVHVTGASLPHVDPNDPQTILLGAAKRVCVETPVIDDNVFMKLEEFVPKLFTFLNLDPLPYDTDVSFNPWIEEVPYPEWRKKELRELYLTLEQIFDKNCFRVGGFIKDEHYPDFKHARLINARNDAAKIYFGPWFRQIEKVIFKLPYFIKKIPKPLRAQYIIDNVFVEGFNYASTDYTSYESHFIKRILLMIERPLYAYMTQFCSGGKEFLENYDEYILGMNKIRTKLFDISIEATRMTGEMNTSLGNGWTNLVLMMFVLYESGYSLEEIRLVVEGDDGLTAIDPKKPIRADLFERLGFTIKMDLNTDLNLASFCGNVFDIEDRVIITDIREVLCKFGWTTSRYARSKKKKILGLLRAKAMSLLYEYAGCPVLQSLAMYALNITEGYRPILPPSSVYMKEQFDIMLSYIKENGLPNKTIENNTRFLVEQLYGVSYTYQLEIERYLDGKTDYSPLSCPYIDDIMLPAWKDYNFEYCGFIGDFDILSGKMVPFSKDFVKETLLIAGIT